MSNIYLTRVTFSQTVEVVEPSREIYRVPGEVEKEGDFVGRPAYDESAAYHH